MRKHYLPNSRCVIPIRSMPSPLLALNYSLFQTDVVNTVCYSSYAGGPISIDQGAVKVMSLSPVMLNKGHTVTEPDGPIWVRSILPEFARHGIADNASQSLNASEYHPQLAIGVADGTCQTTNILRNTRRGGSVVRLFPCSLRLNRITSVV